MTYWVYIWVWAQVEPAHAVVGVQPVRAALEHEPVAAELTLHAVEQEQRIDLLTRQRCRHVHHVDPTCNQWIHLFDTYHKVITCNLWRFWTLGYIATDIKRLLFFKQYFFNKNFIESSLEHFGFLINILCQECCHFERFTKHL